MTASFQLQEKVYIFNLLCVLISNKSQPKLDDLVSTTITTTSHVNRYITQQNVWKCTGHVLTENVVIFVFNTERRLNLIIRCV